MFKSFLAISMMALLAGPPQTYSDTKLTEKVKLSIVYVAYPKDKEMGFCTGFVIDAARGHAITSGHCVADGMLTDSEPSTVLKKDSEFALITVKPMTKPPLTLREKNAPLGEPVASFGYGYNVWTVLFRHLAGYDSDMMAVDGPLIGGMSGGPIVDMQARVVGVNQATLKDLGLASTVERLRDFLKKK